LVVGDETKNRGLAPFLGAYGVKGTKKRKDVPYYLNASGITGGELNAYTTKKDYFLALLLKEHYSKRQRKLLYWHYLQ